MMRQSIYLVSIFVVLLTPSTAMSANGDASSPAFVRRAPLHCALDNVGMYRSEAPSFGDSRFGQDISLTTQAYTTTPCIALAPRLSSADPAATFNLVKDDLAHDTSVSPAVRPMSSARHMTDEMDAFDPNFVVSSGVDSGIATSDISSRSGSPALVLLALAIISIAAISRRGPGTFTPTADDRQ